MVKLESLKRIIWESEIHPIKLFDYVFKSLLKLYDVILIDLT